VARNYIELRTIQQRLRYIRQNIKLQRGISKLAQDRFKAGLTPELDAVQSRLNLANTESEVPSLLLAQTQAINRIAILVGQFPQNFKADLKEDRIPDVPNKLQVSLPADLLRRRPDIRRAERQLAAQTAKIGVATADLYPALTLNGTFHLQAAKFSDMGNMSSRTYSFGPDFRWYVLGGDRVQSNIRIEEARTEQARVAYERAVLSAVEEAENAMTAYYQKNQRLLALQRSVAASVKSVELVRTLYTSGLTDFQNVLDMQRTLFLQQDKLAASRGQIILNLIRIYKAMGGGWPAMNLEQEEVNSERNIKQ
jgi:NodT family efflux transporter outer membrane factor (OMF) lipoprotein